MPADSLVWLDMPVLVMPGIYNEELKLGKPKLKSLNKSKKSLMSIRNRIAMNAITEWPMLPVDECLPDMIAYVDVMIDNADKYYYDGYFAGVIRNTPAGDVFAANDIDNLENAAIKCIYVIYNHNDTLK